VANDRLAGSGYWRLAWGRLRRDPLAMASGSLLLAVFFACFIGAPLLAAALGHGPDTVFSSAVHDFGPVAAKADPRIVVARRTFS
jgi:hypothetical protein